MLFLFFAVCSFAPLFAKLPQPGYSEVTFAAFESIFRLLLPIYNHAKVPI